MMWCRNIEKYQEKTAFVYQSINIASFILLAFLLYSFSPREYFIHLAQRLRIAFNTTHLQKYKFSPKIFICRMCSFSLISSFLLHTKGRYIQGQEAEENIPRHHYFALSSDPGKNLILLPQSLSYLLLLLI